MSDPYELLLLVADQDAAELLGGLIERGRKRGCLRPFKDRILRNARGRHDDFWRHLEEALPPHLPAEAQVLVVWDHRGSGREESTPSACEQEVCKRLAHLGVSGPRVLAVALDPELETILVPAWEGVKYHLAQERGREPPSDAAILERARSLHRGPIPPDVPFEKALRHYPKEMLEALRQILGLGTLATVHRLLGQHLSIPRLKGERGAETAWDRIARQLMRWFPAPRSANGVRWRRWRAWLRAAGCEPPGGAARPLGPRRAGSARGRAWAPRWGPGPSARPLPGRGGLPIVSGRLG